MKMKPEFAIKVEAANIAAQVTNDVESFKELFEMIYASFLESVDEFDDEQETLFPRGID